MPYIDLDVVARPGETPADAIAAVSKGFNVLGEVLKESGPGGGNPLGRFTGSRDELAKLIARYARNYPRGPSTKADREEAACLETTIME